MPPLRPAGRCAAALAAAALPGLALAQAALIDPPELPDVLADWYRVEVLVFARSDTEALSAEQWDPLPTLAYPAEYRFLIDPALADSRVERTAAYASRIDGLGVQHLVVPRPPQGLETVWRPDAKLTPPLIEELPLPPPQRDLDAASATVAGEAASDVPGADGATDATEASVAVGDAVGETPDEDILDEEQPEPPLLALQYQLLPTAELEFTAQARQLRRQGRTVLFHGAWWTELADDASRTTVAVDRSADVPADQWPALQGSISLYRSRFLHANVDLWLNTDGAYLPQGWALRDAPRPLRTSDAMHLDGSPYDPDSWPAALSDLLPPPEAQPAYPGGATGAIDASAVPDWMLDPALDEPVVVDERSATSSDAADQSSLELPPPSPYPWRHAIVHRQAARMRGGEIHYLDHPVIGVVVRLTPASAELPPYSDEEEIAWRERHGLPVDRAPVSDDAADAQVPE